MGSKIIFGFSAMLTFNTCYNLFMLYKHFNPPPHPNTVALQVVLGQHADRMEDLYGRQRDLRNSVSYNEEKGDDKYAQLDERLKQLEIKRNEEFEIRLKKMEEQENRFKNLEIKKEVKYQQPEPVEYSSEEENPL